MKRSSTTWLLLVGGVAGSVWLYDRYHFSVFWPERVQRELLGGEAAPTDALVSKERTFSPFGEGFARWRYKIEVANPAIQRLCGEVDLDQCSFSRSRLVEEGVRVSASFTNGVLTLEEWWS